MSDWKRVSAENSRFPFWRNVHKKGHIRMVPGEIDLSMCCLCGEAIDAEVSVPHEALSMDHVPPKQFYPRGIRVNENLNLWLVPTHKRCNEDFREDEEYFYHAMQVVVGKNNPRMGSVIHNDLIRRTHKPQTPAIMRRVLKTASLVTEGGIYLPPGVIKLDIEKYRIQRVVLKIAQGFYYRVFGRHLPLGNCRDVRLCLDETDMPELYTLSCQLTDLKAACSKVFSYKHFQFDGHLLWTMFFWKAFIFCVEFEDPLKLGGQEALDPAVSAD